MEVLYLQKDSDVQNLNSGLMEVRGATKRTGDRRTKDTKINSAKRREVCHKPNERTETIQNKY